MAIDRPGPATLGEEAPMRTLVLLAALVALATPTAAVAEDEGPKDQTKRRDRRAALKFLKRTMKRYGRPKAIVTDRSAALTEWRELSAA